MIGNTLLSAPRPRTRLQWVFVSAPIGWTGGFIAVWDPTRDSGIIFIDPADYRKAKADGKDHSIAVMAAAAEDEGVIVRTPFGDQRVPSRREIDRLCKFFEKNTCSQEAAFVLYSSIPKESPNFDKVTRSFLDSVA